MEEKIKLSKMQKTLLEYILVEYAVNGKFIETNRQLGKRFNRTITAMQYNLRALQSKGLITSRTVVEDSGYVIRYVTPVLK